MYEGTQDPPLQFLEQQSVARAQESPRVLQALPPGSGAHLFAVQTPVQHSAPEPQVASSCLQAVPPQMPPAHEREQHSPDEMQVAPPPLQKRLVAQLPALHTFEQQSPWVVQCAPAAPQVEVGEAQAPASQKPEQQSAFTAQVAVSEAQVFDGLVQTPLAQALVQQSAAVRQVRGGGGPPSA